MTEYMTSGGVFMIPLALLMAAMLVLSFKTLAQVFSASQSGESTRKTANAVLQIGAFAFFLGILSQIMGLMQAFQAIQQVESVSPALIAGGLYTSFIAPSFGLLILLVALAVWSIAKYKMGD
jgi:biopolymer transport protein ExbB/TolQ